MRRYAFVLALGALLARNAAAQPVPRIGDATEVPTRAPVMTPTIATPVPTPSAAPTPVATSTGAAATVVTGAAAVPTIAPATPISAEGATPTPSASGAAPAPGAELALQLPAASGDETALGDPALFATLSPMHKAWFLREYYRQKGDEESAKKYLQTLVDLRVDSGLWNATSYAAALVRQAREALQAGKPADAVAAAQAATQLAPDHASSHTTLARAELAAGDYGAVVSALHGALGATLRNLRTRLRILANLGVAALAGIWVAFAVFLVFALVRHGRHLTHDFRHALTDKMPGFLAAVLLVPVLAFPLVFGLGVLPLLAWITLVLWIQLTQRERAVAAVFLALGIATPWIAREVGATLAFEGGEESRLYHAIREDEPDDQTIDDLEGLGREHKDPDVLLTIANVWNRRGQYALAEQLYKQAEDAGAVAPAEVGIGISRYARSDVDGAIAAFDKAIAADHDHVAAHFDLSQIYAERTELEKSQSNLREAKAIDARRCDHVLSMPLPPARKGVAGAPGIVSAAYVNHFLLYDELSDDALLARVFADGSADALVQQTWKHLSPALSLPAVAGLFAAALAIAAALTFGFRGVLPTRACPKCGTQLCLRCDGPPLDYDFCIQCFKTYVDTSDTDPRIRAEKERQVARHADRRRLARRALSVLVPGGGHLLGGNTVRGAIVLTLASLLAMRLVFWRGVLRPLFPDGGSGAVIAAACAGAVLAIVWLLGMRGTAAEPEGR